MSMVKQNERKNYNSFYQVGIDFFLLLANDCYNLGVSNDA